ncbi:stage III sporulation protein AC [Desulforudis sp. 1088]|uniref:stage III sporulation protein AC n=1 Tax=unclassified Candidatus Desulforudis TaxID=2635950 RepID=UPI003492AF3C
MDANIGIILKIVGIGIVVAIAHNVLKEAGKESFAPWVTLFGLAAALFFVVRILADLFNQVQSVFRLF